MDPQEELTVCDVYPETYTMEMNSSAFDEILQLYCVDILQCCSYSNVESVLVDYVTSIIEPVGWKAVWQSTENSALGLNYDFVVEVVNVSLEKLEADVYVKSIIPYLPDESSHSSQGQKDKRKMDTLFAESLLEQLKDKVKVDTLLTVPLTQLYTISDDDEGEMYVKTATAIEYVRFFKTHLARPWDGEDDDVVYSEKVLRPRLQLYFDIQNSILPKAMIAKVKSVLKQGWEVIDELNKLYSDMNVSDSESEINEDDLIHSMSLKAKLTELQAKMEVLENPIVRSFLMKKYVPRKSKKNCKSNNKGNNFIIYVVAKEFTFGMIRGLPFFSSNVVEFVHNPEDAFKSYSEGDKIVIFPGVYQCDTLGWVEESLTVEGIGNRDEVVLEATGNSEVFLNISAHSVVMNNFTLRAKDGLLSVVVAHHGKTALTNCVIDSNEADIGILLLGGAEVYVKDGIVGNANEDGIQMRSSSILSLISSKVIHCGRHGIQLDVEDENSNTCTKIDISESQLSENGGYGLFLNNAPITSISLQRPPGDFSVLKFFPWLKYKIEGSEMKNNKYNGIGISSACKNSKNLQNSLKEVPSRQNPDDLDCSILSDLLNEISVSDFDLTKHDIPSD